MKKQLLKKTLRQMAGHLVIESDEERSKFELLNKSLAQTSLSDDKSLLMKSDFSIRRADLFFDETIPEKRLGALDQLVDNKVESDEEDTFRVFVREVPIREQLLHASVPDWAAGARVSHSIGPFVHKDGRKFWYDFFPVTKLIALYVQGVTEPVLLFSIKQQGRKPGRTPIHIKFSKKYTLIKGSIWINSHILSSNAPVGTYVGLTINGGSLTLSTNPVDQDGKLTVSANTTISIQLKLDQAEVTDADENSPYGVDARNMELTLPEHLSFHFSGQGRTIDAVGNAKWNLYGQALDFTWDSKAQATYDPLLQRIAFPYTASEQTLQIRQSKSQFNTVSSKADIIRTAWVLPVASIDITQPTEASGTGAMLAQTSEGLDNVWQKLEGGGINLVNPGFLVSPGQILLADITGGNPHARQSMELWLDEINTFGTKVELTFPHPSFFFYAANANGTELITTFTNADFQVDRPVKVDGEPPAVRSLNSLLVEAVTDADKLIYLFDDNLIQDAAQLSKEDPVIPEPMALALTNALFKVSQVNGCLLFGSLSDDYSKVQNGFLFLTFGLYAYLPTLPDPYAANLGVLRNQIRGRGKVAGISAMAGFTSTTPITSWLVCR